MMCKQFTGDLFKMCKKVISLIVMFMFLSSVILGSYTVSKVFATPKTLYVPTQYPTIQAAIDDANSGDIIYVYNGTYNENLVVNKTISLIGENPLNTIIDGHGTGRDVVNVNNANNVKIEGFTIQNGEGFEPASLSIWRSGGSTISNNVIRQSDYGVKVRESNSSNIINNMIVNNTNVGILLSHSDINTIMGNLIKKNLYGVRITSVSVPSTFYHNNIINNTHQTSVDSPTKWDNGAEGNFWSDYDGQDLNGDGIGDTPYIITEANTDRYPLIAEWSETRNLPFDWKGLTYHTIVRSNSTVASFNFTYSLAQISFNLTGPQGAVSFCNVTIDKSFLDGTFKVLVDGISRNHDLRQNITHTSLYFTLSHSVRKIQIRGTKVVGNTIPTADFTSFSTNPKEGLEIQFTDTSTDSDGNVTAWLWNFGDGNTSSLRNPIHRYMKQGTYNVTLTVTDNAVPEGAIGSVTKTILVAPSPVDYTLYYILVGIAAGAVILTIALFLLRQKKKRR